MTTPVRVGERVPRPGVEPTHTSTAAPTEPAATPRRRRTGRTPRADHRLAPPHRLRKGARPGRLAYRLDAAYTAPGDTSSTSPTPRPWPPPPRRPPRPRPRRFTRANRDGHHPATGPRAAWNPRVSAASDPANSVTGSATTYKTPTGPPPTAIRGHPRRSGRSRRPEPAGRALAPAPPRADQHPTDGDHGRRRGPILRPGGYIVFIAANDRAHRGEYTTVITAAPAAGLVYPAHRRGRR